MDTVNTVISLVICAVLVFLIVYLLRSLSEKGRAVNKTQKCLGCQKKRCVYEETFDSIGRDLAMLRKEEEEARK